MSFNLWETLRQGDCYILMRYSDSTSNKYYGLYNFRGLLQTNWGRWRGSTPNHRDGQKKQHDTVGDMIKILQAKVKKGYKAHVVYCGISRIGLKRPEWLEEGHEIIREKDNKWALCCQKRQLLTYLPFESVKFVAEGFGIPVRL